MTDPTHDHASRPPLASALNAIVSIDLAGRITAFNSVASEMFGYAESEVLGKAMAELIIPPALREQHERGMAQYRRSNIPRILNKRVELTAMRADGSEFPIELIVLPLGEHGRHGFTADIRDISDRKHAEEQLQSIARLVNESPHPILRIAVDCTLLFANGASAPMLAAWRCQVGQKVPKSIVDLIETARAATNPCPYDVKCESRIYSLTIVPVKEMHYTDIFGHEVTDVRQAEHEAHHLAALVRSTRDAVCTSSITDEILTWNAGAAALFGYEASEILGRPASVLEPTERKGERKRLIKEVMLGSRVVQYETTRLHKSGEPIDVALTMSPIIDKEANILGISTIARDITERKRADEALRLSLEEKEVLLREVHHRVKNNLQIISSFISLQSGAADRAETRAALDALGRRVFIFADIHQQLYALHSYARIDLGLHLRNLVTSLAAAHGPKVEIALQLEDAGFVTGLDTAIPLGLIVNELILNSIKHAFPSDSGRIQVSLSRDVAAINVVLTVSDDGVGMADGLPQGAGTGWRILKALVKQLDAQIIASSQNGTAVTVIIPSI